MAESPPQAPRELDPLDEYVNARTWADARAVVERHPELLGPAVERRLTQLVAAYPPGSREHRLLAESALVLSRCRREGIEAAFADRILSPEVKALMEALRSPATRAQPSAQIELARRGLTLALPAGNPRIYATLKVYLGNAHAAMETGRAEHQEQALTAYREALVVLEQQQMSEEQLLVLSNMGKLYLERLTGAPQANLAQAEALFARALPLARDPAARADLLLHLGQAQANRRGDDPLAEQAAAERLFRAALAGFLEAGSPRWSEAVDSLVQLLRDQAEGAHHENVANLGAVFAERLRGDPVENSARAVRAYQEALAARPREALPGEWAESAFNLAGALCERPDGGRVAHIEQAIGLYEEILALRGKQTIARAEAEQALGNAYRLRLSGDRSDNLEKVIIHLRRSLDLPWPEALPLHKARAYARLGDAYLNRPSGERTENLRTAAGCFDLARKLTPRGQLPWSWAEHTHNLGLAYAHLVRAGEPVAELALDCFERALAVYTLDTAPAEHRAVQRNLGDLRFHQEQWEAAVSAYGAALRAGDRLFAEGAAMAGRLALLRENRNIPQQLAWSLVQLGRVDEAVESLEQGRTRVVAELFATPAADPGTERLLARIRALEADAREARGPYPELAQALRRARRELKVVAPSRLRSDFGSQELRRVAAAGAMPLIYLFTTSAGSAALVVTREGTAVELLPLSDAQLHALMGGQGEAGDYRAAIAGPVSQEGVVALEHAAAGVLHGLVEPLFAALRRRGHGAATLVPCGPLAMLPISALAPEEFELTTVPSGRLLGRALVELERRRSPTDSFLGIANPLPSPDPLPLTEDEVAQAATHYAQARILTGCAAAADAVAQACAGRTLLHFACHGRFNPTAPFASALELAQGSAITMGELLDGKLGLERVRLVVLSACQSALSEFEEHPDEALGFPIAFLSAGVPGVIGALWAVDDIATWLLLTRFYRELAAQPARPALALRRAQAWLRSAKGWELAGWVGDALARGQDDPLLVQEHERLRLAADGLPFAEVYYWAGFLFVGID